MDTGENYLAFSRKQFEQYKALAEKAFAQVDDEKLFVLPNEDSNSIAMIVQHMAGNMLSRWTDFLTTDGEKESRMRDEEFEPLLHNRQDMYMQWENGWQCLFDALDGLSADQLQDTVYIRKEAHTVLEAISRQLAHYPYHVGQIIFLAKMLKGGGWDSLSIPKRK
jgi:hypothetical protein